MSNLVRGRKIEEDKVLYFFPSWINSQSFWWMIQMEVLCLAFKPWSIVNSMFFGNDVSKFTNLVPVHQFVLQWVNKQNNIRNNAENMDFFFLNMYFRAHLPSLLSNNNISFDWNLFLAIHRYIPSKPHPFFTSSI